MKLVYQDLSLESVLIVEHQLQLDLIDISERPAAFSAPVTIEEGVLAYEERYRTSNRARTKEKSRSRRRSRRALSVRISRKKRRRCILSRETPMFHMELPSDSDDMLVNPRSEDVV